MNISKRAWNQLNKELKKCGVSTRPHAYTDPKSNKKFGGLALHFDDINKVNSFEALCTVLTFFKKQGVKLSFSRDFDYAVGTKSLRQILQDQPLNESLADEINAQLVDFFGKARSAFMYNPLPEPTLLR